MRRNKIKQPVFFFSLITLGILVALGWTLAFNKQPKGDSSPQPTSVQAHKVKLSPDANFPTPVVQLQQVLAHGMVEVERTQLPLVRGELDEFSQSNIDQDYPQPAELGALRQRLNQLQSSQNTK